MIKIFCDKCEREIHAGEPDVCAHMVNALVSTKTGDVTLHVDALKSNGAAICKYCVLDVLKSALDDRPLLSTPRGVSEENLERWLKDLDRWVGAWLRSANDAPLNTGEAANALASLVGGLRAAIR